MSMRVFANIVTTGVCDDKGRAAFAMGWKGRVIAEPNRPVTCLVEALLGRINDAVGWDTVEDAKADIAEAVAAVKRFGEDLNDPAARAERGDESKGENP